MSQTQEVTGEITVKDGCLHIENDEDCPLNVEGCLHLENSECCPLHINVENRVCVEGTVGITGCVKTCVKNKNLCVITEENLDKGTPRTICQQLNTMDDSGNSTTIVIPYDGFYLKTLTMMVNANVLNDMFYIAVNNTVCYWDELYKWPGKIDQISSYYRFTLDFEKAFGCFQWIESRLPYILGDRFDFTLTASNVSASICLSGCERCGQRSCDFSISPPVFVRDVYNQNENPIYICHMGTLDLDIAGSFGLPTNDDVCSSGNTSDGELLYSWTAGSTGATGYTNQTPSTNTKITDTLRSLNLNQTQLVIYRINAYYRGCKSEFTYLLYVHICDNHPPSNMLSIENNILTVTSTGDCQPFTYQWNKDSMPTGNTGTSIEYEEGHIYNVIVTDMCGNNSISQYPF